MSESLRIRLAGTQDLSTINDMLEEASAWLRTKGTDQWAQPWPTKIAQDSRILRDIGSYNTWIVDDEAGSIATVTCRDKGNRWLWTTHELNEHAVYLSRLVVARAVAGRDIGSALIDWAARWAQETWGARWVRVNAWTTNKDLHNYYLSKGFSFNRIDSLGKDRYPSAALFQKPTSEADYLAVRRFVLEM
jgi:GNAT superfamily N-acetyltransferase